MKYTAFLKSNPHGRDNEINITANETKGGTYKGLVCYDHPTRALAALLEKVEPGVYSVEYPSGHAETISVQAEPQKTRNGFSIGDKITNLNGSKGVIVGVSPVAGFFLVSSGGRRESSEEDYQRVAKYRPYPIKTNELKKGW